MFWPVHPPQLSDDFKHFFSAVHQICRAIYSIISTPLWDMMAYLASVCQYCLYDNNIWSVWYYTHTYRLNQSQRNIKYGFPGQCMSDENHTRHPVLFKPRCLFISRPQLILRARSYLWDLIHEWYWCYLSNIYFVYNLHIKNRPEIYGAYEVVHIVCLIIDISIDYGRTQ